MFFGDLNSVMVPGYMHAHAPYSMSPYVTSPYDSNYFSPMVTSSSFVSATTNSTSVSTFIPTTRSFQPEEDDSDDNNRLLGAVLM